MSPSATPSTLEPLPRAGTLRVVIENISPCIDGGRFAAKRTLGERVTVQADVFADGHDVVNCTLLYRPETADDWQRAAMTPLGNDCWQGGFEPHELGRCLYMITCRPGGWVCARNTPPDKTCRSSCCAARNWCRP
jgi:starch synthase (maltosyl-transferring)